MGRPVFALAGERGRSFLSPTGGDNAFGLFGDAQLRIFAKGPAIVVVAGLLPDTGTFRSMIEDFILETLLPHLIRRLHISIEVK
jgi:hypothetical protein